MAAARCSQPPVISRFHGRIEDAQGALSRDTGRKGFEQRTRAQEEMTSSHDTSRRVRCRFDHKALVLLCCMGGAPIITYSHPSNVQLLRLPSGSLWIAKAPLGFNLLV